MPLLEDSSMWTLIAKIIIALLVGFDVKVLAFHWVPLDPVIEREWSNPINPPPTLNKNEKLAEIRKWLPWELQILEENPEHESCSTDACATQALNLVRSINFSVNPCDNFYDFACGNWIKNNPIPLTYGKWGILRVMDQDLKHKIINILKSTKNASDIGPVDQAKVYFSSCMNRDLTEKQGLQPLLAILERYGGMPLLSPSWDASNFSVSKLVGSLLRDFGLQPLVKSTVDSNVLDARKHAIYIDGPSFPLSPRILTNPEQYNEILEAYQQYFIDTFTELALAKGLRISQSTLLEAYNSVLGFQRELARKYLISLREEKDMEASAITLTEYLKCFRPLLSDKKVDLQLDWGVILHEQFKDSGIVVGSNDKLMVSMKTFLVQASKLVQETPPDVVANHVLWQLVSELLPFMTQRMRDIKFAFSKVLSGALKPTPRENVCGQSTLSFFGHAVSYAFVQKHVDKHTKSQASVLTEHLRSSFISQVNGATWLSPPTMEKAISKAEAIIKNIAHPDWYNSPDAVVEHYTGLQVGSPSWLENYLLTQKWVTTKSLKKLRLPSNRTDWRVHPSIVNAWYSSSENTISLPAGILQPPVFVSDGIQALNYGAIGMIAGHEITHGFDTDGSHFDDQGNYKNWWAPVDRQKFDEKADFFKTQYNSFETEVGNVDGNNTVGENIADNGGVIQALHAYERFVKTNRGGESEARLVGLQSFTPRQLFFLGFSQLWCESNTPAGLANQLRQDVHSPARFRIIGSLQNSEEFATAWNCRTGTYMNPESKSRMW